MRIRKIIGLWMVLGLAQACGGAGTSAPSLNDGSLQVQIFEPLQSECLDSSRALKVSFEDYFKTNSGGDGGPTVALTDSCSGYAANISGTCQNCDSVLIDVGDQSASFDVDASGQFSISISGLESLDTPVAVTPLNAAGELGAVMSLLLTDIVDA